MNAEMHARQTQPGWARVRNAIAAEPAPPQTWWPGWLRWSVLVPLGGLAALVLAIVASLPGNLAAPVDNRADERPSVDLSSPGEVSVDAEWRALAELVGPLDWDTAAAAGLIVTPGAADAAMLDLTSDERRELSRLVATELGPPES